tara:strand:- start:958 stop:1077 length:120 start_codon:yes stop_codon:yes gene_type:complete
MPLVQGGALVLTKKLRENNEFVWNLYPAPTVSDYIIRNY